MSVRILEITRPGVLPPRIAPTARIEPDARVGHAAQVWHHSQIRAGAVVGEQTIIGRDVYIGPGVRVGSRCKIQNGAQVYEPAEVADGVFIGPAAVLTNDLQPRAVTPDGRLKTAADWAAVAVQVEEGASIGAHAVCVAPVRIGRWAMVAAGAVVIDDVPDFALVAGVPARRIGWVGPAGLRLLPARDGSTDGRSDGLAGAVYTCPKTAARFREARGRLQPLDDPTPDGRGPLGPDVQG